MVERPLLPHRVILTYTVLQLIYTNVTLEERMRGTAEKMDSSAHGVIRNKY